ncbi:MAG: hypothetical protein ACYC6W_10860 [Nitrosotalea sp.]
MKPFNLERALAGDKVITKNGHIVLELILQFKLIEPYINLIGTINGYVYTWNKEGKIYVDGTSNPFDLFMSSTKKKLYIAIHKNKETNNHHLIFKGKSYESKEELEEVLSYYIGSENFIIVETEIEI